MWWECPSEVNSTPVPRGSTLLLYITHISLRTAIPISNKAIWTGMDVAPWIPHQWRTLAAGTTTWALKGCKKEELCAPVPHPWNGNHSAFSHCLFCKAFFVTLLMHREPTAGAGTEGRICSILAKVCAVVMQMVLPTWVLPLVMSHCKLG